MKLRIPGKTILARTNWWRIAVLSSILGASLPLFAALGDSSNSIQADKERMKASIRIIQADTYAIHEMRSPIGTVVREYVSLADGRVFGVTWQGPFVPDLKQLLGSYFQQYVEAAKAQRESRVGVHPLNIQQPGLIVQTAGHMRDFLGRAYDPRLLPTGVRADDIR